MLKLHNPIEDIEAIARRLPPFPKVILQLLDLLRDDESSLELMARLIRNDPVLSGTVLGMANHIRRMHAQSDLTDTFAAASMIGVNRVRQIVVNVGMNQFMSGSVGSDFFFKHALAVAITTQEIALMCDISPDEAYVAGILHDVGQLCFHILDEKSFLSAYEQSALDGRLLEREAEIFGLDHCQIGAMLVDHWKLPADLVQAVRAHHDDHLAIRNLQAAVCLGETLARALDIPSSPKNRVLKINAPALELLNIQWSSPEMLDCFGRCHARFLQCLGKT
ncbi:MAG: HDOD domain-containing protein [Rhodoferax sp.]|nr:HDOD domain-containing protein [Rhodoferax sp.]MCF8210993.1 HDOD domain-containing protein [Rhodoferax sp.]